MLHSVTVSNSVNNYHASSMVLNRVYWIRAKDGEILHRHQNEVSTKILGFGVFMIGVVALAIGLIMGVEFPIHIKEKIVKDNCILDKDHEFYEKWTRDGSYVRYNRIFYWHIENTEDFLRGMPPIFTEKGPYVYLERRTRLNVVFKNSVLSYRTMFTQTFSEGLTRVECGHTCKEHDKITTVNTDFLKKLHAFGSWVGYTRAYLPGYIKALFRSWTERENSQELLQLLSCATPQCENSLQNTSNGNLDVANILSFGNFIKQNETFEKQTVLQGTGIVNTTGYIAESVTKTMYQHLSLAVQSFPESCYSAVEKTDVSWKLKLKTTDNQSLPHDLIQKYPDLFHSELIVYLSKSCDVSDAVSVLSEHLSNFSNWTSLQWTFSVCGGQSQSQHCDIIDGTQESILAFLAVAREFVDIYLLNAISNIVLPLKENSIVHTKPQSELAKGYHQQRADSDPYLPTEVAGVLVHHADIVEAFHTSPEVVVGTCLEHGDTDNNMAIRRYNGSSMAPPGVYRQNDRPLSGYTADFPPSQICRACTEPDPKGLMYDVFLPDLFRSLKFEYTDEIEKYDNRLYVYKLSEVAFGGSGMCDLINTTVVHKFPSYVGRPVFDNSDCEYLTRQLESRYRDFTSTIEIEPRTGKFWFESIRLQTSAVIISGMLEGVNGRLHPELAATSTPVPLYWVEKQAKIAQEDIDYFEYKIDRLMTVSCGGLIGLVTLSLMIMVLSVFVGLLSTRKNKVHAMPEEPSMSNRAQP